MKFYIHCEEPELTMVMVWEKDREGKIEEVTNTFLENLKKKYPDYVKASMKVSVVVKNSKGKEIDKDTEVKKAVQHMDDLYVNINIAKEEPKQKQPKVIKTPEQKEREKAMREASRGTTNAAEIHLYNGRVRKAIELYNKVLESDPDNKYGIMGMVNVYLKANRFEKALSWANKGVKLYDNDIDLLKLQGEAYVGCKKPDEARECLMACVNHPKMSKKTEEKHMVLVLLARACLLKGEKDRAVTALQGVLRENMKHVEALVEYAGLIFGQGPSMSAEAVNLLVTVLEQFKDHKRAKEKLAYICQQREGMSILKSVDRQAMSDPQALMFLGNCLRDHSAIDQALELFKMALEVSKGDPCAALIYVHTLEVVDRQKDIIKFYQMYCSKYSSKSVGNLKCSILNDIVQKLSEDLKSGRIVAQESGEGEETSPVVAIQSSTCEYTDDERYLLAFFFTLVKVLYVKGCLQVIPKLMQLLQPLYDGKDLHKTNIRNEAAYFGCISMIYKTYPEIQAADLTAEKLVYFIGDSHCIPPAWQKVTLQDGSYTIHPILSTGTKIWHLRPEGTFYPKTNFYSVIEQIPDGARVIVCLGEIDCREALLKCWEKARYETIEDGIEAVINIYFRVLTELYKKRQWKIFIQPIAPVLDSTRTVVMQFNRILATMLLKKPKLHWLNFLSGLVTNLDDGVLKHEYQFDGTHVHPKYVSLIGEAMSQYE